MHAVFDDLKKNFEKNNHDIHISIDGGGSKTGLMAIKENQVDIGLSSFAFDLSEELGDSHDVVEKVVAYDGIVLITNENNPLDSLKDVEIERIYEGLVDDWSQIGGRPGAIVPIVRNENSGTQRFFQSHFSIDQITPAAEISEENKDIVDRVQADVNAIGFIGFAYFTQGVHEMKLATEDSNRFRLPTKRNLLNNSYPLKRGLRIYYQRPSRAKISKFLDYLNSAEAKAIIESYGLIAVN